MSLGADLKVIMDIMDGLAERAANDQTKHPGGSSNNSYYGGLKVGLTMWVDRLKEILEENSDG